MFKQYLLIKNSFGEKLEAVLRKPAGTGKFPAVLFVSGFGMDLHESGNSNDEIAQRLVDVGFITLQFSFAGRGKSEGDYRNMTLERQAKQVTDVFIWLLQQPTLDRSRVGITATSFGCPTSMVVQHQLLKSLCLVTGVYFLNERFAKNLQADFTSTKVTKTGETVFRDEDGNTTIVGPQFWKSNMQFHTINIAQQIKTPVLMIHGDRDMYVEPKEAKKVFNAFAAQNKRFKLFIGGDHGISNVPRPMHEEFLGDVVEWFKYTL